jgi:hypothetical protein
MVTAVGDLKVCAAAAINPGDVAGAAIAAEEDCEFLANKKRKKILD